MAELISFKFPCIEECLKCGKPKRDPEWFCYGECEKLRKLETDCENCGEEWQINAHGKLLCYKCYGGLSK